MHEEDTMKIARYRQEIVKEDMRRSGSEPSLIGLIRLIAGDIL